MLSTPLNTLAAVFDADTASKALCQWSPAGVHEWHDWQSTSRVWAAHFWRLGLRSGDRVLGLSHNRVECVIALLALARIGVIWVPLNHRLSPAEWDGIARDCTPRLVLHDVFWRDAASALAQRNTIEALAWEQLPLGSDAQPDLHTSAGDAANLPALLVYTSGTTGRPKAAVHTQANLCANMRLAVASLDLQAQDAVLSVLPLFHVGGLCIHTLPALSVGARVVVIERFDAAHAWAALQAERVTRMLQVPATLQAMLDHPDGRAASLTHLRGFDAGSSMIPNALIQAWSERGVAIGNVYGSTETGPVSLVLPLGEAAARPGSSGWPARAADEAVLLSLRDPATGIEIEAGVGELWLQGPNVAQRYWPDIPTHNAQGWFATGDLGERAADRSVRIVGRSKDMIISGGENIWASEVEQALLQHPMVTDCAVWGEPDPQWGERVVVAVVQRAMSEKKANEPASNGHLPLSILSDLEIERYRDHLQACLARYKWPRTWWLASAIPKTALGKPQKHLLRDQAHSLSSGGTAGRQ
jgi:fatty-acyl-CoA synthase